MCKFTKSFVFPLVLILVFSSVFTFIGFTTVEATEGKLVAHYKFDGDYKDYSGNGNNGTALGSVTFVEAKVGKGAKFDGSSCVQVNDNSSLNIGPLFTYSVWVSKEVISNGNTGIFSKRGSFELVSGNSYIINRLVNSEGGSNDLPFKTGLEAGIWTHLAVVSDGKTVKFYVNGALSNTIDIAIVTPDTTSKLNIGAWDIGESLLYFTGIIDDLRIYNYVLTEADIKALYGVSQPISNSDTQTTNTQEPAAQQIKLNAATTDGKVELSWTQPGNTTGLVGYYLYRGVIAGKEEPTPLTDFPVTETNYVDSKVTPGAKYYYICKAVYQNNTESGASNEVSVTVAGGTLTQGIKLESSIVNGKVELSWTAPIDTDGLAGYYIYKGTAAGKQEDMPLTDFPIEETHFRDTKASYGTTYYYICKAVYNDDREPVASNEIAATVVGQSTMVLQIGNPNITVDGKTEPIDSAGTTPVVVEGRTLVPIAAVVKPMGGTLNWNASEKKITINVRDNVIELWVNKDIAVVNGLEEELDVAPKIINGRTMVPLGFVTQNIGCGITWDGVTKKITIKY